MPTTPRRGGESRPSVRASRQSAAAASRPSRPTTTAAKLDGAGRRRGRKLGGAPDRRRSGRAREELARARPVRILYAARGTQRASLPHALRERGSRGVVVPLIAVEPLGDEPIDLDGYDWVLVTSATGARELRRAGEDGRRGSPRSDGRRRTRWAARDLVARASTQEGLLAELPRPAGRVLFAGAEGARRLLVDELGADFVPLYRRASSRRSVPDGDLVVLASPSAARAFAALGARASRRLDRARRRRRPPRSRAARRGGGADAGPRRARRRRGRRVSVRAVVITFLSDFGLEDDFVGTCHGVIKRIAPEVEIIDITHGIEPRASSRARSCSRTRCRTCPTACISPSSIPASAAPRRALVVRDGDGRLSSARTTDCSCRPPSGSADRGGDEITNPEYTLEPVSRDVPRPRRLLARCRSPRARASTRASSARRRAGRRSSGSSCPQPEIGTRRIRATCLYVDRFGNMQLNLTRATSSRLGHRARASGSRSSSRSTATTPSRPGRSPTRGPATSSSTRTRTENIALAISRRKRRRDVRRACRDGGPAYEPTRRNRSARRFARLATTRSSAGRLSGRCSGRWSTSIRPLGARYGRRCGGPRCVGIVPRGAGTGRACAVRRALDVGTGTGSEPRDREALPGRRDRRRRRLAGDAGEGSKRWRAGIEFVEGRRLGAALRRRRVRPRHPPEHDPVPRRGRPGSCAPGGWTSVAFSAGTADADLRRSRSASAASSSGADSRTLRKLRPGVGTPSLPAVREGV